MIVPTQIPTEQKKLASQEDCASPYFSNSMSVHPADEYGSYYVIYHRGVSGESRDDNEHETSNHSSLRNDSAREDDGMKYSSKQNYMLLSANNSMVETETERQSKSCAHRNTTTNQQSSPAVSELSEEDSDNSEAGFVSYTAEACVACSIPVLHFLQFFMC